VVSRTCLAGHINTDAVSLCVTCGAVLEEPKVPRPRNGWGVTALVLGLISLVFAGLILGILAIVAGSIGVKRADTGFATNRRMAQWGRGLGVLGVVAWFVFLVIL
jgi:hypothetical protein